MRQFDDFINKLWQDPKIIKDHTPKLNNFSKKAFGDLAHSPKNVLATNISSIQIANTLENISLDNNSQYDTIIALDEEFTFCNSEEEQSKRIVDALDVLLPNGILLTSIKDYRNFPYNKKPVGDTSWFRTSYHQNVLVELLQNDPRNNQQWTQTNLVTYDHQESEFFEVGNRRTLYFKQLAKLANDNNCQFGVFTDLFWKSYWRKQSEHVVWVKKLP